MLTNVSASRNGSNPNSSLEVNNKPLYASIEAKRLSQPKMWLRQF